MKRKILYLLLVIVNIPIFTQNFSLDGKYRFDVYSGLARIDINQDKLTYIFQDEKIPNSSVDFSIIHIDGISFIKLAERVPKEVTSDYIYENQKDITTDDKILILVGKASIYKTPILIATTKGFDKRWPCTETVISNLGGEYKDCTSFLTEKNKSYPIENLGKLTVDTPWVENAPGYGIGESFVIGDIWNREYKTLLIMNGYISYEKPYLYKQNGRVKKIKVKGLKSGKEKVLDVLDTPHPQTVDISFITEPEDIRITIEDVYPGSKYEDTCIHYIATFYDEVIPYENSIK